MTRVGPMAHSELVHVISNEGNADMTCSAVLDPGKDGHVVKDATRGPHPDCEG